MKKFLFYVWAATMLVALFGLSPLSRASKAKGVEASPNLAVQEAMAPIAAAVEAREEIHYDFLWSLVGKQREQVLGLLKEQPIRIDQNGFGFEETGIHVWFDDQHRNAATRVAIVSAKVDLNGAQVGKHLSVFTEAFGSSIWDNGEEAHFEYGNRMLVVRYYPPARTVVLATIMDKAYYQDQYLPRLSL